LEPYPDYRIVGRTESKHGDWIAQLFSILTNFPGASHSGGKRGKFAATKAVVFGRSTQLDRWIVVYGETFPTTRRAFNSALSKVTHADDAECWCVVWGQAPAQQVKLLAYSLTDGCCMTDMDSSVLLMDAVMDMVRPICYSA